MPTPFTDNLKFQLRFLLDALTTIPRAVLAFLFYSVVHQLLGCDPAPGQAAARALQRDFDLDLDLQRKPCPYARTRARTTGAHEYVAPAPGTRGPCPALNVMANHGYLPRNGQNISGSDLTHALIACYDLSRPLAAFLAWGGVVLLGQVGLLALPDLARHDRIEHDASLTHANAPRGCVYAPSAQDPALQALFAQDARGGAYTLDDIARARVRREADPAARLSAVQQEVARGEVALVLQIFGGPGPAGRVPKEVLQTWWFEERLPDGWAPTRRTTLLGTVAWARKLRDAMNALRDGTVEEDAPTTTKMTNGARVHVQMEEPTTNGVHLPAKSAPAHIKKRQIVAP